MVRSVCCTSLRFHSVFACLGLIIIVHLRGSIFPIGTRRTPPVGRWSMVKLQPALLLKWAQFVCPDGLVRSIAPFPSLLARMVRLYPHFSFSVIDEVPFSNDFSISFGSKFSKSATVCRQTLCSQHVLPRSVVMFSMTQVRFAQCGLLSFS